MAGLVPQDVPMVVKSSITSSERRVTPSWTISHFKTRLEPITGIPPSCQALSLRIPGRDAVPIEAANEDATQVGNWALEPYGEIYVTDSRPKGLADATFTDVSAVPKYTMPEDQYAGLSSSVLAWKKANKLGRFDPNAPEIERTKLEKMWGDLEARKVQVDKRCQLGTDSSRRGRVAYVGVVDEIPGIKGGPWVGIVLDEPAGRNDGSVNGKRYFQCDTNRGVFVRPERVEIGDYEVLDDDLDAELEEI